MSSESRAARGVAGSGLVGMGDCRRDTLGGQGTESRDGSIPLDA